jgi:hypothetical protein
MENTGYRRILTAEGGFGKENHRINSKNLTALQAECYDMGYE